MSEKLDNKIVFPDGQIVLLSLIGFEQPQIKAFFSFYRDQISQGRIHVIVTAHEFSSLSDDVLQIVDVLVKRSIFEKQDAADWRTIFKTERIKAHKCFLVVHDMRFRNNILEAAKEAHVFVNFLAMRKDGSLGEWANNSSPQIERRVDNHEKNVSPILQNRSDSFQICTKPSFNQITRINSRIILSEKKQVSDGNRKYSLLKKEMINNGAVSYRTDAPGIWVKLYDTGTLTSFKENKVKRMLSKPVNDSCICWPISCAYDEDGLFRGYFFREPKGEPLHMAVLKEPGVQTYFPNWNRIQLAELLKTILQKIVLFHDRGVLIGCLNPATIRVVNQQEIYWIDTDDLQIEDFYTIASNLSFRPPEYINKQAYYATLDSDYFIVAELVFMIMMLGKSPYGAGIISDPEKLLLNQRFLYAYKEKSSSRVLPGISRFMWSHLTEFKTPLYETLQLNGSSNIVGNRLNDRYWLSTTSRYISALQNPIDPESLNLYPKTFKHSFGVKFIKCKYCGVEHPEFFFHKQKNDKDLSETYGEFYICDICFDAQSEDSFKCEDCNRTFYYPNHTAIYHQRQRTINQDWKKQRHCDDCKRKVDKCVDCGKFFPFYQLKNGRCRDCNDKWGKATYQRLVCKDCGQFFVFTNGEHESYTQKELSTPSRCKACRERRKSGGSGYSGATTRSTYTGGYQSTRSSQSHSNGYGRDDRRNTENEPKKSFWDKLLGR